MLDFFRAPLGLNQFPVLSCLKLIFSRVLTVCSPISLQVIHIKCLLNLLCCTVISEENQKKYAENDARFKDSPILKKLLEQSKLNKEKNKQETLDKYCIRGAEWGVGDCSTAGMTPDERDKFIAMLKQKAGVE